jgi:RNA polymerase sigma-70 factor (ECF subfamily)
MLATRESFAILAVERANDLHPGDSFSNPLIPLDIGQNDQPAEVASNFVKWQDILERIQRCEESGMEDLYRVFGSGIRYYLCWKLGHQELEDKVHDTLVIVVQAIRRDELREPERLMGFVRTVVRRQVVAHIDEVVHSRREESNLDLGGCVPDRRDNPEQSAAFGQKVDFVHAILRSLSEQDREILTRFYLDEQSPEQIRQKMELSETQFRLLKSRAKARFGAMGRRKLQRGHLISVSLRTAPTVPEKTRTGC